MLIFVLGGLAGAVFYLPFKKVKAGPGRATGSIYAVFGLIVVPWVLALMHVAQRGVGAEGSPGTRNSATVSCAGRCGASAD